MNPFLRTPSFTAIRPVAKVTPSPVSGDKVSRPTLHLPTAKQGVTRRTWPFLNSVESLAALDSLESPSLLNH